MTIFMGVLAVITIAATGQLLFRDMMIDNHNPEYAGEGGKQ